MYPIPPTEHLIERKVCRQCTTYFPITDKDMEFYEKVSPVFPKASFAKEVPTRYEEVEDFISETSEQNPSPAIAGTPFLKGASQRYLIPPPTLCPDCRQQRRLSFRNERKLYKRKCDATGKEIVSIYSPDKPYTVYHQDYWWSDAWDPMSYGREVDLTRSMIEQFKYLYYNLPKVNLWIRPDMVNCDYCNF